MRRRLHVIAAAVLTVNTFILFHRHGHLPPLQQQSLASANATLGFGTILAVSRLHSRRPRGLLWAANLTDLRIEVSSQPDWTGGDLHSFRLASNSSISEGSALAWLGHLHALRTFFYSDASTALILEDDADFSLSIRLHQIPLLASKLRKLLGSTGSYWPHPSTWNILYPGHCDDALPSSSNPLLSHPHTLYPDATTPPHVTLHPDTSNFLRLLCIPEKQLAYAVHRRSAELIVQRFAKEERGVQAFDVRTLRACAQGWKCWSVSPEVVYHGDGGSEIAAVDSGSEGGDVRVEKGTWNVECGARHGRSWIEEGDVGGREEAWKMVREILERGEGECLVDLVRAERSWKKCEWEGCGAQS